jgi:hypothetical protein
MAQRSPAFPAPDLEGEPPTDTGAPFPSSFVLTTPPRYGPRRDISASSSLTDYDGRAGTGVPPSPPDVLDSEVAAVARPPSHPSQPSLVGDDPPSAEMARRDVYIGMGLGPRGTPTAAMGAAVGGGDEVDGDGGSGKSRETDRSGRSLRRTRTDDSSRISPLLRVPDAQSPFQSLLIGGGRAHILGNIPSQGQPVPPTDSRRSLTDGSGVSRGQSSSFTERLLPGRGERAPVSTHLAWEGGVRGGIAHMTQLQKDELLLRLLSTAEGQRPESDRDLQLPQHVQQPGQEAEATGPPAQPPPSRLGPMPIESLQRQNDSGLDPAIVDLIRQQEEEAMRISGAAARLGGSSPRSGAGILRDGGNGSNRANSSSKLRRELEELTRAIERSLIDTGGTVGGDRGGDDELARAIELSRRDVGGRGAPPPGVLAGLDAEEDDGNLSDLGSRQDAGSMAASCMFTISGAGSGAINGVYTVSGTCNSVPMYNRKATWEGQTVIFTLYRCLLDPDSGRDGDTSTPRLWFISIVAPDASPGTDGDRDFYVARGTTNANGVQDKQPPESGWAPVEPFGKGPGPTCKREERMASNGQLNGSVVGSSRQSSTVPEVHVITAGSEEINGVYKPDGTTTTAGDRSVYVMTSNRKGATVKLHLFPLQVEEDEGQPAKRKWFISVVPKNSKPGTHLDLDLYTADEGLEDGRRIEGGHYVLPPMEGWRPVPGFGQQPPPVCLPCDDESVGMSGPSSLEESVRSRGSVAGGRSSYLRVMDEHNSNQTRNIAICVICRARPVTHVLVPCGHPCLCECCAGERQVVLESVGWACPIARCNVCGIMRFYGTLTEENVS